MHLLLGLRRLALSIVDHALQLPAIVLGSRGEALDRLPRITAGPGVPDDKRPAASLHLRTDVTGAAAVCVSTGTAWGAPIEEVETAAAEALDAAEAAQTDATSALADAATAQAAAEAAQTDATQGIADAATAQAAAEAAQDDVDTINTLLGDLSTLIPGMVPDLATGFSALVSDLNGKLSTSRLRAGSVTILAAATSGVSADLGNGWSNKAAFAAPASAWGLASKCVASISAGVVTVSVDVAPGTDTVFWFLVADVS